MKMLILGCFIFPFSLLGIGARPLGMGSAYISVAADVNAIFYNPAGIATIKENEVCWTKVLNNRDSIELKEDIAFCNMIRGNGFGLSYIHLLNIEDGYADLNYNGKKDNDEPYLGDKDNIAVFTMAGYGENLLKKTAFGINIKRYSKILVKSQGTGGEFTNIGKKEEKFGVDIGILHHLKNISLGVTVSDLNEPGFEYENLEIDSNIYDYKIIHPITLSFGISLKPDDKTIIAMDVYGFNRINNWYSKDKNKRAQSSVRFGFEREVLPSFAIRGGCGGGFYTIGFGIKIRNIKLDYAIMEKENMGFHIFSLMARWQSGLMRWS